MQGELTLLAALTAGLVGSSHCVAMCGGIAAGLASSRLRPPGSNAPLRRLAGLAHILFGIWTAAQPMVSAINGGQHQHGGHTTAIGASGH